MSALQRRLWRELRLLRGQVLAIGVVLAAGIGMMVMALSNHAALSESRALYYGEYRFAEVFAPVKRAPHALLAEVRGLPGVRDAQARVVSFATLEVAGFDEAVTAQFVSLPIPGDPDLNRVFLRRGALAVADDEVVVGESFADAHGLQPGDALVAVLNGRRQSLRISGIGLSPEFVYAIRPGDMFPDYRHFGVLWMPREPLARVFELDGAFNELVLTLDHSRREADLIDALDRLLADYGGRGAHGRDQHISHRFLDEELSQLQVMARMFSAIFMLVTAFLVNIVLGRLIASQREQIAVLKAFGYSRAQVAWHFAQLALVMVGAGILPGLALGAWLGRRMANMYLEFYRFPYLAWELDPGLVLAAIAFALLSAALGTATGLARVFRLQPAEAMRPEAPPSFRRSISERMGLSHLLSPAARMILRNLERRPLRSVMSVVGIGMAGGVLLMARFQGGAIEQMVDVQLGFAQRDSLAVALGEPTGRRAAFDLARLPGVQAVEPFRTASVRLHHGHRSYLTALQGLPQDGDLRRVLDADLRPVSVPVDGIMLTDHLAGMLAASVGDPLEVEFLEGHRRRIEVPLAGVVSEYMGVGAYARRETVNRLLGEGDVISGAWLAIDEAARAEVLQALRGSPRVAAVTDRSAMVEGFRETIARGILTFTVVASLMAASICVGVVYNAARITLAERGRELASLRVLGYTRQEVRVLLVGELFTLGFLALLPGALIGYGMATLLVTAFSSDLYRIPLVLTPSSFALSALTVLAATALSAALVRGRLDRLDLVAVLKSQE